MVRKSLQDANYFDDRHKRSFKRFLICLLAHLRDPKNNRVKTAVVQALRGLYTTCFFNPADWSDTEMETYLGKMREGHRAEWAHLLCNTLIAEPYLPAGLFSKMKAASPFPDKKILYVEWSASFIYDKGEDDDRRFRDSAIELVRKFRTKDLYLIERFCVLFPASGEGGPEVIPLEQHDGDP